MKYTQLAAFSDFGGGVKKLRIGTRHHAKLNQQIITFNRNTIAFIPLIIPIFNYTLSINKRQTLDYKKKKEEIKYIYTFSMLKKKNFNRK